MSAISPGCCGVQPKSVSVRTLEAGLSIPANLTNQPKWLAASSGDFETTGSSKRRPITPAISRNGTPSSAIP